MRENDEYLLKEKSANTSDKQICKSKIKPSSDKNFEDVSEDITQDRDNSNLIQNINKKLEIRRKSQDGINPLEKEVFSQTLIYAAKEALNAIHTEDTESEPEEFPDTIRRKLSNSARRLSKSARRSENEKSLESNNVVRAELDSSDNRLLPSKGNNPVCDTDNKHFERRSSKTAPQTRRNSSVKHVTNYNKMAEKKKTIRRKESFILIPVKDVKGLTPEQIEEIKKSFNDLDGNKDGRISRRELIVGAYRLGMNPTDDEVEQMMKMADKNNDGFIDFNEYVGMMRENYVTIDIERERMKAAFALLDSDGDGFLSKTELMGALVTDKSGLTTEDVEDILKDADMDGNEQIDFNEFVDSTICRKLF